MFKSMRLKNFKAYKDSGEVPLAPLTVIVGANNSGKSTLFQAILGLAQTTRDAESDWTPRFVTKGLVDLSGIHEIVHRDSVYGSFEITVSLDPAFLGRHNLERGNKRKNEDFHAPSTLQISFEFDEETKEILLKKVSFGRGEEIEIAVERQAKNWDVVVAPSKFPLGLAVEFINIFPFLVFQPKKILTPVIVGRSRASKWAEVLKKQVSHVGPLRQHVPWNAALGARARGDAGLNGENLLADLGSNEKDRAGITRLEHVHKWLARNEVLKRVHLFEIGKAAGVRMLLGDEPHGPSNINIAAMGEGVSQLLPILAYSLFDVSDDCLLVEQPEIHLHPALQAALGDLFIDVVQTGHRQVLVETHSEHLLLRVRRRIAEGSLNPDQVAILFVEKHGGESKVRRLDLNSRGHFSDWPKGFFDEAYQEAMALATAASKKG